MTDSCALLSLTVKFLKNSKNHMYNHKVINDILYFSVLSLPSKMGNEQIIVYGLGPKTTMTINTIQQGEENRDHLNTGSLSPTVNIMAF